MGNQQQSRRNSGSYQLSQGLQVSTIDKNLLTLKYPYNADLCDSLLSEQDNNVRIHLKGSERRPQLLIQLDGISELGENVKNYIKSAEHQELYSSVAFVLSQGNMAILERHYLNFLIGQLQNSPKSSTHYYPMGLFNNPKEAIEWLSSRPGSHHRK